MATMLRTALSKAFTTVGITAALLLASNSGAEAVTSQTVSPAERQNNYCTEFKNPGFKPGFLYASACLYWRNNSNGTHDMYYGVGYLRDAYAYVEVWLDGRTIMILKTGTSAIFVAKNFTFRGCYGLGVCEPWIDLSKAKV